jgi:hypothetical protein
MTKSGRAKSSTSSTMDGYNHLIPIILEVDMECRIRRSRNTWAGDNNAEIGTNHASGMNGRSMPPDGLKPSGYCSGYVAGFHKEQWFCTLAQPLAPACRLVFQFGMIPSPRKKSWATGGKISTRASEGTFGEPGLVHHKPPRSASTLVLDAPGTLSLTFVLFLELPMIELIIRSLAMTRNSPGTLVLNVLSRTQTFYCLHTPP